MSKKIVVAYITTPTRSSALKIGKLAVDSKLAACANVLPQMTSVFRWKGKIETAKEWVLILKTTSKCLKSLKVQVKKNHPYENPCLIAIPVKDGLPDFLKWISESTK